MCIHYGSRNDEPSVDPHWSDHSWRHSAFKLNFSSARSALATHFEHETASYRFSFSAVALSFVTKFGINKNNIAFDLVGEILATSNFQRKPKISARKLSGRSSGIFGSSLLVAILCLLRKLLLPFWNQPLWAYFLHHFFTVCLPKASWHVFASHICQCCLIVWFFLRLFFTNVVFFCFDVFFVLSYKFTYCSWCCIICIPPFHVVGAVVLRSSLLPFSTLFSKYEHIFRDCIFSFFWCCICCLYPQHEHISRVSFFVCLSVFACTLVHSNSPTHLHVSQAPWPNSFRTHLCLKTCAARLFDPDTEHTRVPQW